MTQADWVKEYEKWFFENISQFMVRVHFAGDKEEATKENLPILEEVFMDFIKSQITLAQQRTEKKWRDKANSLQKKLPKKDPYFSKERIYNQALFDLLK